MTDSKSTLVEAFESLDMLADRYTNIQCVNFRPGDVVPRAGSFSLVFRAIDTKQSNNAVAIKIMNPDYLADAYRTDCFQREPLVLQSLQGHSRCLRLVDGHKIFDISTQLMGKALTIPVGFFVTEWLEVGIEDYFFSQDHYECVMKLNVLRSLVLAVKALHDNRVHHRDLKRDNLRMRSQEDMVVVAIDLGTAARLESLHLAADYGRPVGHSGYSPPEAFAGFAGIRELGCHADAYAIGAMMYELFMPDVFFAETIKNPVFKAALHAAILKTTPEKEIKRRINVWQKVVRDFARSVQPPSLLGVGSTVPVAVRIVLNDLYSRLTAFDYTKRLVDLNVVIRRLDGAIRCISNEKYWNNELTRRRKLREDRIRKAAEKHERTRARSARYLVAR